MGMGSKNKGHNLSYLVDRQLAQMTHLARTVPHEHFEQVLVEMGRFHRFYVQNEALKGQYERAKLRNRRRIYGRVK